MPRLVLFKVGSVKQVETVVILVYSLFVNRLVNPIPNKAAAHIVILLKIGNVFLKVAERVFHAVRIFAKQNRLCIHFCSNRLAVCGKLICNVVIKRNRYRFFFTEFSHRFRIRVHSRYNIALCQIKVALVVERPCIVKFKRRLFHFGKV